MKKLSLLFAFLFLLSIVGCSGTVSAVRTTISTPFRTITPKPAPLSAYDDTSEAVFADFGGWTDRDAEYPFMPNEFLNRNIPVSENGKNACFVDFFSEKLDGTYLMNMELPDKKKTVLHQFDDNFGFYCSGFHLNEDGTLYFVQTIGEKGLFSYRNKRLTCLSDKAVNGLYFDEECIFFEGEGHTLYRYTIATGKTECIPIGHCDFICPFSNCPNIVFGDLNQFTIQNVLTGASKEFAYKNCLLSMTGDGNGLLVYFPKTEETRIDAIDLTDFSIRSYSIEKPISIVGSVMTKNTITVLCRELKPSDETDEENNKLDETTFQNSLFCIDKGSGKATKKKLAKGFFACDAEFLNDIWYITGDTIVKVDEDFDNVYQERMYAYTVSTQSIKLVWKGKTRGGQEVGSPEILIEGKDIWEMGVGDDYDNPERIYTIR